MRAVEGYGRSISLNRDVDWFDALEAADSPLACREIFASRAVSTVSRYPPTPCLGRRRPHTHTCSGNFIRLNAPWWNVDLKPAKVLRWRRGEALEVQRVTIQ